MPISSGYCLRLGMEKQSVKDGEMGICGVPHAGDIVQVTARPMKYTSQRAGGMGAPACIAPLLYFIF